MAICKNKKRGQWFISYKEKTADGSFKTRNITNAEWSMKSTTLKYMKSIEKEEIEKDKNARGTSVIGKANKDVTLEEAISLLEMYLTGKMMDKDTIYAHKLSFKNYLFPVIPSNTKVSKAFTPTNIASFRAYLVKKNLGTSTMNNKMVAVKTLIDYCRRTKLIDREMAFDSLDMLEPVKAIRRNKEESNFFRNGQEDLDKFFDSFADQDTNWLVPLKTMFYGALRIGEWLALTRNDCDFIRNTISVDKQLDKHGEVKNVTKGRETRTAHIPSQFMQELYEYCEARSKLGNELLFKSSTGSHIGRNTVARVIEKHCKIAGIEKITPHGLRHSFATRMFDKGYDVKEVQEQLGHSDMATTMSYYIHHTKGKDKDFDGLA